MLAPARGAPGHKSTRRRAIDRSMSRASSSSSSSRTVSPRAHHHHHAPARVSSRPPRPLTPRARPDACAGSAIGRAMGRFVRRVRPARARSRMRPRISRSRARRVTDGRARWRGVDRARRQRRRERRRVTTPTTPTPTTPTRSTSRSRSRSRGLRSRSVASDARRCMGGGYVRGRDWSMGSCDTFKTRRSQRLDDWTTTRTHKKTVGRTRSCVGIFKYASSRRERRGMIGEASADEARKPWRWFWC